MFKGWVNLPGGPTGTNWQESRPASTEGMPAVRSAGYTKGENLDHLPGHLLLFKLKPSHNNSYRQLFEMRLAPASPSVPRVRLGGQTWQLTKRPS